MQKCDFKQINLEASVIHHLIYTGKYIFGINLVIQCHLRGQKVFSNKK